MPHLLIIHQSQVAAAVKQSSLGSTMGSRARSEVPAGQQTPFLRPQLLVRHLGVPLNLDCGMSPGAPRLPTLSDMRWLNSTPVIFATWIPAYQLRLPGQAAAQRTGGLGSRCS